MLLPELKEQLVKGIVKPLYIFTGPEVAIMDVYIAKIIEVIGAASSRPDEVQDIYAAMQSKSFITKPTCYIIRDDKDYTQREKVWPSLIQGHIQGSNVVILVYSNIDKRSKFYKYHESIILEFEHLIPEVLAKYIKKDIDLDPMLGIRLAELCENDYARIRLESDKLTQLASANGLTIDAAFRLAVKEKLIQAPQRDNLFELIDAICKRKIQASFDLYASMRAANDNTLGILSLLYTNIRATLLVQVTKDKSDLARSTGLTSWQIKIAQERCGFYSDQELAEMMQLIRKMETGIKTGEVESSIAVDVVMVMSL